MEGCREEKIFCGFEQRLALKKTYTRLLMGENLQHMQNFSRQKTQYIFQSTLDLTQERRHFFPLGNTQTHPYTKKSREISHQMTLLFLTLFEMETKKHIPFFPADRLSFVYANYKLLSKAYSVSNRKLAFSFSS